MDQTAMLQEQEQSGQESGAAANPAEAQRDREPGSLGLYVDGNRTLFEPLVEPLREHGLRLERDVDALFDKLQQDPESRAIVLFSNPVMTLAEQLREGQALPPALAAWRAQTERLLAVFRRARARITLADGHAALGNPDEFRRQLETRWSVPGGDLGDSRADRRRETVGVLHLVVAQALAQDDAAAALQAELEASSLALGPAYAIDIQGIIDEGTTPASAPELDEIREENELMRLQLRQLQAVYETQVLGDGKLEELRADTRRARLARKSVEMDFSEAREAWREERKVLTDKLKWTADDLAAIRRSLSWRVTAPLRRVLGIFFGGSKL